MERKFQRHFPLFPIVCVAYAEEANMRRRRHDSLLDGHLIEIFYFFEQVYNALLSMLRSCVDQVFGARVLIVAVLQQCHNPAQHNTKNIIYTGPQLCHPKY